jgi:hypothetical protein
MVNLVKQLITNIIWKSRKSNEKAWKRKSSLESLTDYMSKQKCKEYMYATVASISKEVEDLKYDEKASTITYFKEGKKYHYSLVPAIAELNTGNDYCVVRSEFIYSP